MGTDLLSAEEGVKLAPEVLVVVNNYLMTNDIGATSNQLRMPREKVIQYLNKREAKKYIDTVFLEQGYFNRGKIAQAMTDIIEKKLEELEEAEMSSTKDIADLLVMVHKMRMDEVKVIQAENKATPVLNQTNVQNNIKAEFGQNYTNLLKNLTGDDEG